MKQRIVAIASIVGASALCQLAHAQEPGTATPIPATAPSIADAPSAPPAPSPPMTSASPAPAPSMASAPSTPDTPSAPDTPSTKVGGHIGVALPLVTVSSKTTTISDNTTILNPIGVSVKMSPHWVIDFETVVSTPVKPKGGSNGLVVDPGVVYDWGGVATGLRAAWQIGAPANFGLIPLINKGLVDLGRATWFVEAAFPTFYQQQKVAFNVVFHTGVGF